MIPILVFLVTTRRPEKFSDLSDLLSVPEFPAKDNKSLPANKTLPTIETPLLKHREKRRNGHSLVLVEIHEELRNYLVRILMPGYEVVSVCDAEAAFVTICGQHPDVVPAFSVLAGIPGEELAVRIKSNDEVAHVPAMLLVKSGEGSKETQRNADLYVTMPFAISFLKVEVESLITNRKIIHKRYIRLALGVDAPDDVEADVLLSDGDQGSTSLVRSLIEERSTDSKFTIDELSGCANMNRPSFYNGIEEITGHAPADHVRSVRLNKALILLMSREYTVVEAADVTGFNDPKYFRIVFKRRFGDSPTKYISSLQVNGRPARGVPCRSSFY